MKFASEVLKNLEMRVARLEKQSIKKIDLNDLAEIIAKEFSTLNPREVVYSKWWIDKVYSNLERFFSKSDYFEGRVQDLQFEIIDSKRYSTFGDLKIVNLIVVIHSLSGSEQHELKVELEWNGRLKIKHG
tara:strand:+ start:135 stop:524 length:390 start_codon:yes stop_codon:yes gene_type:complete